MGKPSYFEFGSKNPDKTAKFFQKVFGWKTARWEDKEWGVYWHMKTGGIKGGVYKSSRPEIDLTISVKSLDKTIAKIKKLGGKIVTSRTEMGDWGAYATLKDPMGNKFSVMEEY